MQTLVNSGHLHANSPSRSKPPNDDGYGTGRSCPGGNCQGHNSMLKAVQAAIPLPIGQELAAQGISHNSLLKASISAMNALKISQDPKDKALLKALTQGVVDLQSAPEAFMNNVQAIYKGNDSALKQTLNSFMTGLYIKAGFDQSQAKEIVSILENMSPDTQKKLNALSNDFTRNIGKELAVNPGLQVAAKAA